MNSLLDNLKFLEPKTKEEILKQPLHNAKIFEDLTKLQKSGIGKIQVGCIVEALEFRKDSIVPFEFHGCNIHVSDSFADTHAERMAIDLALKDRCYPITAYVTSMTSEEKVMLCGSCRHFLCEINENCNIVVFDPDGSIKEVTTVKDVYPFHKDVKKKNQKFFELCLGGINNGK